MSLSWADMTEAELYFPLQIDPIVASIWQTWWYTNEEDVTNMGLTGWDIDIDLQSGTCSECADKELVSTAKNHRNRAFARRESRWRKRWADPLVEALSDCDRPLIISNKTTRGAKLPAVRHGRAKREGRWDSGGRRRQEKHPATRSHAMQHLPLHIDRTKD